MTPDIYTSSTLIFVAAIPTDQVEPQTLNNSNNIAVEVSFVHETLHYQ